MFVLDLIMSSLKQVFVTAIELSMIVNEFEARAVYTKSKCLNWEPVQKDK